ncbi:MAG: hypothetical protein QM756_42350 [Polyangiaceae bacterium]
MKSARMFSSLALMISVGVAQLIACSSDSKQPSSQKEESGALRLPLQTMSASGHVYRLRNAFFTITSVADGSFVDFLSSETDPTLTTISKVLNTGDYTITLNPGWFLERVVFDGSTGGTGAGGSPFPGSGGVDFGGRAARGGAATAGSTPIPSAGSGAGASVGGQAGFDDIGEAGSISAGAGGVFEETGGSFGFGGRVGFGGSSSGGSSGGGSTSFPVQATLVSPAVQFFGIFSRSDSFVTFSFQVGGEVLNFNEGRLNVGIDVFEAEPQCDTPADVTRPERVLLENNVDALAKVRLRDVFTALANNGQVKGDPDTMFNQIYDSYATADAAQVPSAVHCGDETTNGVPTLNGFPIDCNRQERFHVNDMDSFRALAIVNRIDLAPENGANCGQQRMIFATNTQGRAFMIVEAQVPNPQPELGIQGCAPLAQFWLDQNSISDAATRGQRLAQAFFVGDPGLAEQGFPAFYNPANLTVGSGQIRTNQFDSFPWTLREFKLTTENEALKSIPFPTAEAPNGQLWNENSGLPQGEACRQNFLAAVDGLLTPDTGQMSFVVDQQCRDAESRNDFSQAYAFQMSDGFRGQLQARLAGTGLTADEVANRAQFAGSCMGCHQESSGANLGLGVQAPFSSDFPHVTEFSSTDCGARNAGSSCFPTSTALKDLFLPSRLNTLTSLLGVPIISDPCEGGGVGGGGGFGGFSGAGGAIATGKGGSTSSSAGSVSTGSGGQSTGSAGGTATIPIASQGPAPVVVITVPDATTPLSELVTLDAQIRLKSGAKTIGGRSAQVTH